MLTDAAIKALKPKEKLYKIVDRDGMYVVVQPSGAIVFRLDYRLNGRRETLTLGRYGPAGLSLARAREKVVDARRAISEGRSPAQEKQREKRRLQEAKSFGQFGERWLQEARMADSTRAMRRSIFERDILPAFRNRLLPEILPEDLRALCAKVKERGAPATAVHVRDIVTCHWSFIQPRPEPSGHLRLSARVEQSPGARNFHHVQRDGRLRLSGAGRNLRGSGSQGPNGAARCCSR